MTGLLPRKTRRRLDHFLFNLYASASAIESTQHLTVLSRMSCRSLPVDRCRHRHRRVLGVHLVSPSTLLRTYSAPARWYQHLCTTLVGISGTLVPTRPRPETA
ncbi:hypothetical protein LY76DRAFT_407278 [Colletotrichum caudatum]|nr:hypothetical protein LY76DRAFT_407278 [Colletotrichum caudatum]